jgi:peptidoglycan hydrolase-like amidase
LFYGLPLSLTKLTDCPCTPQVSSSGFQRPVVLHLGRLLLEPATIKIWVRFESIIVLQDKIQETSMQFQNRRFRNILGVNSHYGKTKKLNVD